MSTFARLCRSVVLVSIFSFAALALRAQQTLRVPADFPTIQGAINAANTGDTVLVSPGTYFENLTISSKEITLQSTAGAAVTILDGQRLNAVLTLANVNGLHTTIDGFTFQNGSAPPPPSNIPELTGGGVYAVNSGLTVANSNFRSIIGPSVLGSHSTLSLRNSTIITTDGSACTNAGVGQHSGVYLTGDSVVIANGAPVPSAILGNTISGDGSFCAGSGIGLQGITTTTLIQNNTLRNNLSAFYADYAAFNLVQNLIYDNGLGAVGITGPLNTPSTGPPTMFVTSNTMVNNHTSQDLLNGPYTTEIGILNSAAQVVLRNNILVGTTQYALLSCSNDNPRSTANDTPLLLDHNDLFNTSGGLVLSGNCFPNLAAPLAGNGNLSADPRFSSSTNLYPQSGSPVLDAGVNLTDAPLTDIAGNPRFADATGKGYPITDLGAYERIGPSSVGTALSLQAAVSVLPPGTLSLSVKALLLTSVGTTPLASGSVTILVNGSATSVTSQLDATGSASLSLPLLSPGIYALTATLSPSLNVQPATSPVVYVQVTPPTLATTTLTIIASPTTQVANQPVSLAIHLGSLASSGSTTTPGPVPPGDVTLSADGTILSMLQPDGTGLATYTVPHPAAGNHTYTVSYAGTSSYSSALASTGVSITAPVATSLTATATPNPAPLNTPITCAVRVVAASGPAPTGTVTFTDGATPEGTVVLTSATQQGVASASLTNLSLGLHTITITFQPDPGFSPSAGTCTVNVGGDATVTSLSSSKNPAATTDVVTYSVTVTSPGATASAPAAPAGSVTLSEGNTLLASAPLTAGSGGSSAASLPVTLGTAGLHLLTATYTPATAATFTSSATLSESIVAPPPILTVLTASPNPATVGSVITLTATATSQAALPTPATITFLDGGTVLGAAPLSAGGTATLTFGSLSLGSHPLTAVLRTDASSAVRSTSSPLTVQVKGLDTTVTLAASPSISVFVTSPVTLSATVVTSTQLPPGATLGGTATFFDGGLPLGTGNVTADGHASLELSTLAVGVHLLTVSYSGNSFLNSAMSGSVSETVLSNATSTALSLSAASSTAFVPVTLTAHVASATSSVRINTLACPPACLPISVTFTASTASGTSVLGTVAVDGSGNASLPISPAAGALSISAAFSGSTFFSASASATSILTVAPAATALTLSANPNPVYQHGTVTLTAALTAPGVPASALGGTVTFLEGSTPLGTATLSAAGAFSYTPGSVGTHTVTAVFSGTGSLSGSSATATVTVLPSDFVLSLQDPSLTIATTHHAPTALSINTTGSLADHIDLSCANLPQYASCTFAPATHDLTASTSSTGSLVIDTDALLNYAGAHAAPVLPGRYPGQHSGRGEALAAVLALCLPTTLFAALRRLRRRGEGRDQRVLLPHLLAVLLASVAAVTLSGCSGLYPPHVAPGTYTITVTGHARTTGVEHSATLTVVVTP